MMVQVTEYADDNVSLRQDLHITKLKLQESQDVNGTMKEELDHLKTMSNPEAHEMYKQLCSQVKDKEQDILNLQENCAYSERSLADSKARLQEKEQMFNLVQKQQKEESEMRLKCQEQLSSVTVENKQLLTKVAALEAQLERSRSLTMLSVDEISQPGKRIPPGGAEVEARPANVQIPCIFEVKEKDKCFRGTKCPFDHNFDPQLRNNAPAIQKLLSDTSKHLNKCAIEMVDGKCSNMPNCSFPHKSQVQPRPPFDKDARVCFRELVDKGSCKWGDGRCRFSHKISDEQRTDVAFREKVRKIKDEKASKCINEYKEKGKCRRGLDCPFSHTISEEDKQNKELRQKVADRKNIALGKDSETEPVGKVTIQDLKEMMLKLAADVHELKHRNP